MLSEKLKSWTYYKQKLPLYIQNSYGIEEHFKMIFDAMIELDKKEDDVLYMFNIFDDNYLNFINTLDTSTTKDKSDVLDKLGTLFGLTRTFDVDYIEASEQKSASLHLTNSEFLKLIKAQIIRNNFVGTHEEIRSFYNDINLPIYVFNSETSANADIYLDLSTEVTENEKILFLANLFTVNSMGITYTPLITHLMNLCIWNSPSNLRFWDKGMWSI